MEWRRGGIQKEPTLSFLVEAWLFGRRSVMLGMCAMVEVGSEPGAPFAIAGALLLVLSCWCLLLRVWEAGGESTQPQQCYGDLLANCV